jgi:four helix bundle protein
MPDDRKAIPFERLDVFRRAYRISLEIHKVSLAFPDIERYALADQIRRASKSVCANLVEGFAKQALSPAEFRRFIAMALGSADEMRLWSRYCLDLGYIDETCWQVWRDEYQEVAKMLQGLLRKSRARL